MGDNLTLVSEKRLKELLARIAELEARLKISETVIDLANWPYSTWRDVNEASTAYRLKYPVKPTGEG